MCAVFIGTFIGGFIKKYTKHLIEEPPKHLDLFSYYGIISILNVKKHQFAILWPLF